MKHFFTSCLLVFTLTNSWAQQLPIKSEVISKMKLANDYWISQNSNPGNNQWARAVYFTGNMDFYKIYPKETYLQYANLWANNSNWSLNGGTATRNADNQTCGQVYIDLYNLDQAKQQNKISAIKTSIDNMVVSTKSDDWWWIDALFMAMPVYTRLGVLYNDSSYFNKMHDIYYNTKVTRGLYNTTENLWYRDETFDPPYATKNGQDSYWARGNGWVIAAHVRVLQLLPTNDSHRNEYIETLQKMAEALKIRQRADGFWNTSLDDPAEFDGPETSGTAFFTYGIAWGINNHLLDSVTYTPIVLKAWQGLTTIALQPNGFLGYTQGVGASPALASAGTTQDFGVGAFLLAGTEILKLATGTIPTPVNFGLKSVQTLSKNQIKVTFTKSIDNTTALVKTNYSINNGITINSVVKDVSDSTVILSVSNLIPAAYTLQTNNIKSSTGEQQEVGETKAFSYSGITAITASAYETGSSNTPDKTMDFDFSTRWSADGKGQWIMYDLGEEKTISSVDIAFYNGAARKTYFNIELSTNGNEFNQVYIAETTGSSGASANLENYDFSDQDARFVRIVGFGNSTSTWNSITEARINWKDKTSKLTYVANNTFKVYPNPMKGSELNIESNSTLTKVVISDLTGKIVYISENNENRLKNIQLKSGIYYLTIQTINSSESKLLVVE